MNWMESDQQRKKFLEMLSIPGFLQDTIKFGSSSNAVIEIYYHIPYPLDAIQREPKTAVSMSLLFLFLFLTFPHKK